ncbi:Pectinesterase inhibitor 2 [Forsythia ovata]|uniref:Pectinesterase inhibitor 2 n=1 Tax=Forsythia ovata TaxID=205694 RepID=A0ABD1P8R7_9LAMI
MGAFSMVKLGVGNSRSNISSDCWFDFTYDETDVKAPDLVSEICSKTRNPSTCLQVLGKENGGNLSKIAQTLTGSAHTSAFLAYDTLQLLVKLEKNSFLKDRYQSCLGNYVRAIGDLAEWKKFLNSRNYQNLPSEAKAISKEIESCDKNFEQPPSEPSQLKQTTQYFEDICSILVVVSNRLTGRII